MNTRQIKRLVNRIALETLEQRRLLSTVYVDAHAPAGGTHDGTSWATAYLDLQPALTAAASGTDIRVADGAYKPTTGTSRTVSFALKNGVGLYGGYAGYGAADPDARDVVANATILSGDIGAAGSNADNSYHVVVGSSTNSTAVLGGFTVTLGNANGSASPDYCGGGMYNSSGSPTIVDCTFSVNSAPYSPGQGGGMYNSSSSPTIVRCTFSDNSAYYYGAMYNGSGSSPTLTNCSFSGNSSVGKFGTCGGMYNYVNSSPTLTNCTFSGNNRGALVNSHSSPTLIGCSFSRNPNGAISNSSSSSPLVRNCTFTGNSIYNDYSSPTFINCMFSGPGMRNVSSSSSVVINCTFSGGGMSNSSSSPTVRNSVFWGGSGQGIQDDASSTPSISYCDVQGGHAGIGNIDTDPRFMRNSSPGADGTWGTADDDYGDLRISAASACVDAGSNAAVPAGVSTDLAGGPRFLDVPTIADTGAGPAPIVDMGAYEATPALAANAGGPYYVLEGQDLTLIGRGASDAPGAVSYAWEWDGDGLFDDAFVPDPVFSTTGLSLGTISIALRVTDAAGRSVIDTTSVTILRPVLYVDADAPTGGDGNSWGTAYPDLQSAIAAAATMPAWIPAQIHVGGGTYKPTTTTDRTVSFHLRSKLGIYGGYAGYGASDPDARDPAVYPSTLSGDIGTVGSNADNSFHVLIGSGTDATAVLDGFTVAGGNANDSAVPNDVGGGIYVLAGNPKLANCTFNDNSAISDGGGMYNESASPTLTNCTFSGNSAVNGGGGISDQSSSPTLINCTFTANSATLYMGGGGMYNFSSSPALTNCTFAGNSAAQSGGGIYNNSASPTLNGCTFTRNSAEAGGGMYNRSSSPTLTNCTFNGNSGTSSYGGGGGMYNYWSSAPSLVNCSFSGNWTVYYGGGMGNYSSSPSLINCTFAGNNAETDAGGGMSNDSSSSPSVTNSIVFGNTAPSSLQIRNTADSVPQVSYSDVQGGYAGTGNIDADPRFVRNPTPGLDGNWGTADDDYGDLRLQATSPCIDVGNNSAVPSGVTTDIAAKPRFVDVPGVHDPGPIVDMGAYEYQLSLTASGGTFLFDAAKPTFKISFNRDISVASLGADDLLLQNLTTGQPVDCSDYATVSYDTPTCSASWAVSGMLLPDGNYRATLPAGSVADVAGDPLAADYSFDFFSLAGDANHDRIVDVTDLGILATNWQGLGKTFTQGDFNYDGVVDVTDLGILATNWQKSLSAPAMGASGVTVAPPRVSAAPVATAGAVRRVSRGSSLVHDVLN